MAEITEIITSKLEEFNKHTDDLLSLVKELKGIKEESNRILAQIEGKLRKVEDHENLLKNLREEASRVIERVKEEVIAISKEINKGSEHLQSLEQRITQNQERVSGFLEETEKDIKGFKEEVTKGLDSRLDKGLEDTKEYAQQTRVIFGREITEFLKKQNVLITNLTQQIDACQRAIDAFKIEIGNNSQTLRELEKEVGICKEETKNLDDSGARLREEIVELRRVKMSMEKELNDLKSKFEDTEFAKKLGIGWILTKKRG